MLAAANKLVRVDMVGFLYSTRPAGNSVTADSSAGSGIARENKGPADSKIYSRHYHTKQKGNIKSQRKTCVEQYLQNGL